MTMSGVSGDGVTDVLRALSVHVLGARTSEATAEEDGPWRP